MTDLRPETSIIIRTFNEERFLPALLRAIEKQKYQDFEIIVVDSGSYDRTPYIAQEGGARLIRIDSRDFTFGYSLNMGIKEARGRVMVIVSAHAEPVKADWLGKLVAPLQQTDVAMVYGRQMGNSLSNFSEASDFRRMFGADQKVLTPPNFFANNANSAIRKDLWEQHPFDEALTGLEDIEWAKFWIQKAFKVVYEPEATVYHIHEESWRQVYRRYYREAIAAHSIEIKSARDIPKELFKDARHLAADLFFAGKSGCLAKRACEITLFRFNKCLATALGLLNGNHLAEPLKRDALYFDRTCKAVVVSGPHRARLEEIRIPAVKPSEVLIEVAFEGVCGTDVEIFGGSLGYYKSGLANYPIIPGHEFSGWVARVGANVHHLRQGDRVVVECIQSCGACDPCFQANWIGCGQRKEVGVIGMNGGYCEYVVAPSHFVHKIPDDLTMEKAALCEPTAVVLKGLKRIEWALSAEKKKLRCALVGAGAIGHLCAQILAFRGYDVTAFDRQESRLAYFKGSRIDSCDDMGSLSQYDVIVEATGHPDALRTVLHVSKPGATLLLLGLPYAMNDFNFEDIVAHDKSIVGSVGSSAVDFDDAIGLLPHLEVAPLLRNVLPLERYADAWSNIRRPTHLKTLLKIRG